MPVTINGTGTKYYGNRESDIGGTYITTEWVVVVGIPLLPLSSWRVYPRDDDQFRDHQQLLRREASHTSQSFEAERVPLNWKQVANIYAVTLSLLGICLWMLNRAFPGITVSW